MNHRPRFVLAALLFTLAPAAFAADVAPPPSKPATTPPAATAPGERVITKVSFPLEPGGTEKVTADVDVNDAPEFKDWTVKAAGYALKWYPEICKQLASPGFTPPREFTIRVRKDKGVAYTTGGVITINVDYLKGHQDDLGMVAHELVHVIQKYKRNNAPDAGWLTEGIADYVRYFVVEPGAKNARFDVNKSNYKRGYQPAAGLLNFAEQKKAGTVAKLNQALREGKFTKDTFKEIVGSDSDALWEEFKKSK